MRKHARVAIAMALFAAPVAAWVCPDDGQTAALSNNQVAGNYRVHHTSGDPMVRVKVVQGDTVISDEALPTDREGLLVGVPVGASVIVYDEADANSNAAEGTIALENP